jgi:hypothetical protein
VADAHWVHLPWDSVVDVGDEIGVALLLEVKIIYVNAVGGQVGVELGLLWELALVDFLGPKGMLS